jgi:hypothetical protein
MEERNITFQRGVDDYAQSGSMMSIGFHGLHGLGTREIPSRRRRPASTIRPFFCRTLRAPAYLF